MCSCLHLCLELLSTCVCRNCFYLTFVSLTLAVPFPTFVGLLSSSNPVFYGTLIPTSSCQWESSIHIHTALGLTFATGAIHSFFSRDLDVFMTLHD